MEYATDNGVGVKFSTNGSRLDQDAAHRLAAMPYTDVQISLDGTDAETNDAVRGTGSFAAARAAMDHLAKADFGPFKISVVVTRHNASQLDEYEALADNYGAQLRLTRLHPTQSQQVDLYHWLLERPNVLTGDSFFHLNALGDENLPGLNLCGAGRVVCLIDPVGDVYACPFVLHNEFKAGNVLSPGGFTEVWRSSELFTELREPQSAGACAACGQYDACQGGCMAAKFFTGIPLDGPDPEWGSGHGAEALAKVENGARPLSTSDHSRPGAAVSAPVPPVPVTLGRRN